MTCDICFKTGVKLTELRDVYKVPKIQHICDDCLKDVESHLFAIRNMQVKMEQHMIKRLLRYKRMYSKK